MEDFEKSLMARGIGAKDWPNTHTEVEYLGGGKFAASIGVGHRVFFDKADGNKPKKHKLTDNRPDHVVIQSAKCCVEVYPYYSKYFDTQHEEVRLEEERWVVQRLFKEPDEWRDVDAYNPQIAVEEYSEPAGDVVKVTVTYDTDYGILTVEYFQRDGNNLKHNVTFKNTSNSTETFRVVQKWTGIAGQKVNNKETSVSTDSPYLAFHDADKPAKEFNISENLLSMVFNPDRTEKTEHCLQRPVSIETSASGLKANFVYGNWKLADNEILEIDPATATLNNPNEDGEVVYDYMLVYTRNNAEDTVTYGSVGMGMWMSDGRGYVEWDISSIAGKTLTANPIFKYHGNITLATDEEINPLKEKQPSDGGTTDEELYGYIATGTAYVNPFNHEVGETKQVDLGGSAKTDLQTAMTAEQAWFAIGFQSPADEGEEWESLISQFYSEECTDPASNPKPTLYVEYTVAEADWLPGWGKRVRILIDHTDIDAALSNFPVLVALGTSVGRGSDDVSFVFDELTLDANRKKIAVTTSDGTTECYVEIEKWDDADEEAWLWVKVPSIVSYADTALYLYYDITHADNGAYVGDPDDAVVHNVWDSNFKLVSHMRDDPDASHIRDSTVNANDGTKKGAGKPAVTAEGKIDGAQDFNGEDDYIQLGDVIDFGAADSFTLECWMKSTESIAGYRNFIRKDNEGMGGTRTIYMLAMHTEKATGLIYDGTNIPSITGDTDIHTGALFHVVFVRDVGEGKLKLRVNGAPDALDVPDSTTETLANDGWLALGAYANPSDNGEYLDGIIDEVRISNIARTVAWIKASYETERDHLLDFGSEETATQLVEPSPVAVSSTVQAPGASGSGSAPITLSPVQAISAVQAPAISATGAAPITPSPVVVTSTVQTPRIGRHITASIIVAVSQVQSPSVAGSGAASISPAPIASQSMVVAPGVAIAGQYVLPSPVQAVSAVQTPLVSGSGVASISPSPIVAPSAIQTPTVSGAGVALISLSPIQAISSIQPPTVFIGFIVAPLPLPVISGILAPSLSGTGVATIISFPVASISEILAPRTSRTIRLDYSVYNEMLEKLKPKAKFVV